MLLKAAAAAFAEFGYEVPLQKICAAAGIGRATLYRNFRDRKELALAVMQDNIEALERHAGEVAGRPGALDSILHMVLDQQIRTGGLVYLLNSDAEMSRLLTERFRALIQPSLHRAQQAGLVHPGVNFADLQILTFMMWGAVQNRPLEERIALAPAVLALCRRSISA